MKRSGSDPMLLALRHADCTLSLAARLGGPRRIRSSLGDAGGFEIDLEDDAIALAHDHRRAVESIADREIRQAMRLVMDTRGCRCRTTVRDVAAAMNLPVVRVHRLIRRGCEILRRDFAQREAA